MGSWGETYNRIFDLGVLIGQAAGFGSVMERRLLRSTYQQPLPSQIVFVCKGNICRSPYAEAKLLSLLKDSRHSFAVSSAGLSTTPGKPADTSASQVAHQLGVDLSAHRTRRYSPLEIGAKSSWVFVLEPVQRQQLLSKGAPFPLGLGCLGSWSARERGRVTISDPYGGPSEQFCKVFAEIDRSLENFLLALDRR